MSKELQEAIVSTLTAAVSDLSGDKPTEAFVARLAQLIEELDQGTIALLRDATEAESREEQLYSRSLSDFSALSKELGHVRSRLGEKSTFIETLKHKGRNLESMNWHLGLVVAMDRTLQHLIHLMQYDSLERGNVDIRNGFHFTSGSMHFGHTYFEPPK